MLSSLRCVDLVLPIDEPTPLELTKQIEPDVLVKFADYRREDVVRAEFIEELGGEVLLVALLPGRSTSRLVECIQATHQPIAGRPGC